MDLRTARAKDGPGFILPRLPSWLQRLQVTAAAGAFLGKDRAYVEVSS